MRFILCSAFYLLQKRKYCLNFVKISNYFFKSDHFFLFFDIKSKKFKFTRTVTIITECLFIKNLHGVNFCIKEKKFGMFYLFCKFELLGEKCL